MNQADAPTELNVLVDEKPLLERICFDLDLLGTLAPKDVDTLGIEITLLLGHCCVPESIVFDTRNTTLMFCILSVDNALTGATKLLFRTTISTKNNLEALLRLIYGDIQTGNVRCLAVRFLHFRCLD
jgi:hypothetical protein